MSSTPCTFYGVLNGTLTTSKNCVRKAIHAAIEQNGFVWGVAMKNGTLLVINRSEDLAKKWLADRNEAAVRHNEYRASQGLPLHEIDGVQVVKVYAGKAAAEAACQPAEAPEAAPVETGAVLEEGTA